MKQSSFFLLDPLSKYMPQVSTSTQHRRTRSRCSGGSKTDGSDSVDREHKRNCWSEICSGNKQSIAIGIKFGYECFLGKILHE